MNSTAMFKELQLKYSNESIANMLSLHIGTVNRWDQLNKVPDNYFNDLNSFLNNKYTNPKEYRNNDQFYTTKKTAELCYKITIDYLKSVGLNPKDYVFIEPSAGCCNFYRLLPSKRRIGIDIEPKGELKDELIKKDYLKYYPDPSKKYIVIGNPPFGLRGNLALRFINHSYDFADVVAFILPPLFNSTGKGVPMKRVNGYKLAKSIKLKRNSFEYPDGKKVDVATIFQIWTKVCTDKIKIPKTKTCDSYIKVYSLSNGKTPSTKRNVKMIGKCDIYLPSTCFSGMKYYNNFKDLPNKRGYGIVIKRDKDKIYDLLTSINWEKNCFISTNGALNLRTDLIQKQLTKRGYFDEH